MKKSTMSTLLLISTIILCVLDVFALLLKPGDPLPKPVPPFSRVSFKIKNNFFHIDAKMRCRYNDSDRFMYRKNHPFASPTNIYFEIGTVLKVTDTQIIYGSSTNAIGSKSCFLIEGKNIIPNRFVPDFQKWSDKYEENQHYNRGSMHGHLFVHSKSLMEKK